MGGRAWFEGEELDRFWRFVRERQAVWYRRVVRGDDPPWTDDETLRRYRFTNVYRLLDPGTQYAIQDVLERDAPAADRVFNVLVYRLVGRSATHAQAGFQRLDEFDASAFERSLRARREARDEPVFTGAYVVAGYSSMGGADKVANVARLFGTVRDRFEGFYGELVAASGPREAYEAIRDLPGYGNFLAYQVLVDLLYPLDREGGEPFLPFSPNEWAAAGPGAERGLGSLLDEQADAGELEAMRWLWRNQAAEFDRMGLAFDWLRGPSGRRVDLTLADVQNCLCEFYKHRKVSLGTGRARRRFRPEERRSTGELEARYADAPVSLRTDHYRGVTA